MKVPPLSDASTGWTSDCMRRAARRPARGERLRAAKALDPRRDSLRGARAEERAVPKRRPWRRRSLAWAAAWLLFGMTVTAGAMTAGWWPVRRPASLRGPDHELEVPARSTLRVGRRGRWRGTLVGPGVASVAAGDADVIRLSSGLLVLAAEAASVAVWGGPTAGLSGSRRFGRAYRDGRGAGASRAITRRASQRRGPCVALGDDAAHRAANRAASAGARADDRGLCPPRHRDVHLATCCCRRPQERPAPVVKGSGRRGPGHRTAPSTFAPPPSAAVRGRPVSRCRH